MPRLIFIFLFILLSHRSVSQFDYGFKFGINGSTYRVSDLSNEKFKAGFNGGFLFNIPISKNFYLQPEVLYNEKGYKYGGNYPSTNYLDYISIPVLCGYKATNKLSFLAGPELDFLINEEHKSESGIGYSDTHKKFDLSIDVSIALKATQNFGIDARYCYGLISTNKILMASPNGIIEKYAGNNRVFQLNLFYVISSKLKR